MPNLDPRRALLLDVGLVVLVAGVSVVTAISSAPPGDQPTGWGLAILVGGALALVARRRAPVAVLVVTCLSVLAYTRLEQQNVAGAAVLIADTLELKGWLLASGVIGEVVRKQRLLVEQADGRAAAAERR